MLPSSLVIVICLVCFSVQGIVVKPWNLHHGNVEIQQDETKNTYHIFNAIHSSMRQWGSSLNHNGVSFFIANVPEDTQFYHGTSKQDAVTGMQWLAFEPEHALLFARSQSDKPPGNLPNHPPYHPLQTKDSIDEHTSSPPQWPVPRPKRFAARQSTQSPLRGEPERNESSRGWLHTYRALHDLRLLYIDGMSAAKVEMGTMDSQDYVLINTTANGPGYWDDVRGQKLCEIAQNEWGNQVQGFVRMEAGFEVVLCSFEKNLRFVNAIPTESATPPGGPGHSITPLELQKVFQYYQAITARFHGIGGGRVTLDYEDFVTSFTYPIDLFDKGKNTMPRLEHVPKQQLAKIKQNVTRMALSCANRSTTKLVNWQSIADMIVARYSTPLLALFSSSSSLNKNITLLQNEIHSLLRPFIVVSDGPQRSSLKSAQPDKAKPEDDHDIDAQIDRCTYQFLPTHSKYQTDISLAFSVLRDVSHSICSTLSRCLLTQSYATAMSSIRQLVHDLDWTSWKQCPGPCALNEVCYIPIWPLGGIEEDHERPACRNASEMSTRHGYWSEPSRWSPLHGL